MATVLDGSGADWCGANRVPQSPVVLVNELASTAVASSPKVVGLAGGRDALRAGNQHRPPTT